MNLHASSLPRLAAQLPPDELRSEYLVAGLFRPGEANFHWWETDRTVLGAIVPTGADLPLPNPPGLKSAFFLERREAGVINLGGPGVIRVDGTEHALDSLDGLYLGRGAKSVTFASKSAQAPARFWLLSYPAHTAHPARHV